MAYSVSIQLGKSLFVTSQSVQYQFISTNFHRTHIYLWFVHIPHPWFMFAHLKSQALEVMSHPFTKIDGKVKSVSVTNEHSSNIQWVCSHNLVGPSPALYNYPRITTVNWSSKSLHPVCFNFLCFAKTHILVKMNSLLTLGALQWSATVNFPNWDLLVGDEKKENAHL